MALTKVTGSVIKDSVSLSGNVSVGGTLTYQDVTNVDALGIGTFRTGIKVLAGQVDVGNNIKLGNAGVITATSFSGVMSGTTGSFSGQVNIGSNIKLGTAGVITATSYRGDGSQLTGITGTTINNNANNRVITGSGSANTLEAESNLTFDGTTLGLTGNQTVSGTVQVAGNSNFGAAAASPSPSALTVKMATNKHIGFSPSQSEVGNVPALVAFQDNGSLNSIGFRGTDLRFAAGSSERLRIDSGGRLLVGDSNATGAAIVQVQKTSGDMLLVRNHATNYESLILSVASGTADIYASSGGSTSRPALRFITNDAERLRIQSNGRVNIGVNPQVGAQSLLNLKGSGDDGNQTVLLRLGNDSSGAGTGAAIVMGAGAGASSQGATIAGFYDGTGTSFTVGTNASFNGSTTERFRIRHNGNTGIGDADPQTKLHVAGSICGGTSNQPFLRFFDSSDRQRNTKHYFKCVKGGTTIFDILTVDINQNFHQALIILYYGARIQNLSDSTTYPVHKIIGVNRFNGGSIQFTKNTIVQNANATNHADIDAVATSSTNYRIRLTYSGTAGGSSFCCGSVEIIGVGSGDDGCFYSLAHAHGLLA